jgi:predicted dinucleotide-binding enzyme
MTTIGIIGAGQVGSHIARAAIASGYDVVIANSRAEHVSARRGTGTVDATRRPPQVRPLRATSSSSLFPSAGE